MNKTDAKDFNYRLEESSFSVQVQTRGIFHGYSSVIEISEVFYLHKISNAIKSIISKKLQLCSRTIRSDTFLNLKEVAIMQQNNKIRHIFELALYLSKWQGSDD